MLSDTALAILRKADEAQAATITTDRKQQLAAERQLTRLCRALYVQLSIDMAANLPKSPQDRRTERRPR